MLKTFAPLLVLLASLTACAHRGAVRVECDGPLRPINVQNTQDNPPVTVEPAKPGESPTPESHP